MERNELHLEVMIPEKVILSVRVSKVIAESVNGSFCLLPKHVDYVSVLSPGILIYETIPLNNEYFIALDEGILVKIGQEVLVSVHNAITSDNLGELEDAVREQFKELDEEERLNRSVLEKLEADFVRRFVDLQEGSR